MAASGSQPRERHDAYADGAQWVNGPSGSLRNPQSNRCLDVPASNPTNGRQLQIYDCNGTGAQNWTLP